MIVEYTRYKIPVDRQDKFLADYKLAVDSLRASKHCLFYELTQCTEDPTRFILRLEWDSEEGHLNPNISAINIEGGVAWGLSAAFKSEITFDRGRTVQSNFHDYQILRLSEMPPVEVYFINSGVRPLGGTGEVGPVTVIPAVTNALFAATGKRYRSLPLSRHGLRLA